MPHHRFIVFALGVALLCSACGKTSHLEETSQPMVSGFSTQPNPERSPPAAKHAPPSAPRAYPDINTCASDGRHIDECKTAYGMAEMERQKNAPSFESKTQCEAQFIQCSGSEGTYRPVIAGFMVGHATKEQASEGTLGDSLYRTHDGGISRLSVRNGRATLHVVRRAQAVQ